MKYKPFLFATICVAALLAIERVYSFQNGGFRSSKLISNLPSHLSPPPAEMESLLNQSFCFFGSGGTSFVFLGEDGKTILKLFKHQHLLQKNPLLRITLPGIMDGMRINKILSKQRKNSHKHQSFFFNSCRLACELKEETGLIYLCLQPNSHFAEPIKLIDSWGFIHRIDLCKTEFAIQKRADLFFPYLENLLKLGRKKEIKLAIDALIRQIQTRCRKGIGDRDPNLLINFGFIEGKAIEFDLGSYFLKPSLQNPLAEARELFFSTQLLQKWLKKHCPELLDYFLASIFRPLTV